MYTYIVCFAYTSNLVAMWHSYTETFDDTYAGPVTMDMEFCVQRPASETLYWFMPHHK